MKDHLIKLLTTCAPENGFAQDAIDWALLTGRIHLTLDLATGYTNGPNTAERRRKQVIESPLPRH